MNGNHLLRKSLAVGIILLFVGTCIIPAIAQVIEKSSESKLGSTWLYVGGSEPGNYSTIMDAVVNATDGDTVFVFSGIYHEYVYISKSINLIGEDPTSTIIDGTGVPDSLYETVYIVGEDAVLSGFTIKNTQKLLARPRCVIVDASYVEIHDNIITGSMIGIQSGFGRGVRIFRNTITNNSIGCFLYYAELTEVSENNFIDNFQDAGFINCWLNLWDGNYWDTAFLKVVKIIIGGIKPVPIPLFNFDWHPAQEPYDI